MQDDPPSQRDAPTKTLNPRQQELLTQVQHDGFASVETLAKHFGVTHQTIRRDINHLSYHSGVWH